MYIPRRIAYLSKEDSNFFHTLRDLITECLECVVYYEKFKEVKGKYKSSHITWYYTTLNAYQQVAVIRYCNLFKVSKNEQINQKMFFENYYNPKFGKTKGGFEKLLEDADFSQESYDKFNESVIKYRDKFVGHRDYKYLSSA